jgi:hypothetical protein
MKKIASKEEFMVKFEEFVYSHAKSFKDDELSLKVAFYDIGRHYLDLGLISVEQVQGWNLTKNDISGILSELKTY